MQYIKENLKKINDNIVKACKRAGRDVDSVTMVAVTKTANTEQIIQAIKCGCSELGENRIQHFKQVYDEISDYLEEKKHDAALPDQVNWHMIGHLQRNKVKQILPMVRLVHSVDTLRLAEEICGYCEKNQSDVDVLLQVNCSEEVQKFGVPVGAAVHLAEQICSMEKMNLRGIMTMAPLTEDEKIIRQSFSRAREIFDDIKAERFVGDDFQHISMGMSNDYEIAVEEGATILRIGSAIFNESNE